MYLRALLYGIDDLPADPELRKRLDAEFDHDAGEPALLEKMAKLDPAAFDRWHACRRRLIRALEVRLLTGKSILELQQNPMDRLRYPVIAWKLETPTEILRKRISDRAAAGLLESPTAHQALGYKLIAEHLAGNLTREQLHERISTATWQLARRQRTWFRHQHPEAQPLTMPPAAPLVFHS